MSAITSWAKNNWGQIVVVGLAQATISGIATWAFRQFITDTTIRDIGIVAVWIVAIIAGTVFLVTRSADGPRSASGQADDMSAGRSTGATTEGTQPVFHAQTVRVSVSQVHLDGLVKQSSANEVIELSLNVDNHSGFPVRITGIAGFMLIGGERQESSLTLEPLPIVVTYPSSRSATVRQVTPDMRTRMFAEGMYGKRSILSFNLGNLRIRCETTMPDGSVQDDDCAIVEPHFLVRGPFRSDEDYEAVNRMSSSWGNNIWYGADGPNEHWYSAS